MLFNIDLNADTQDQQPTALSPETEAALKKYSKLPADEEYTNQHWKNPPKAMNQKPRLKQNKLSAYQLQEIEALKLRNLKHDNFSTYDNVNVQLGTVIEGNTEFYNRLTKKQRSKNIIDELLIKDSQMKEQIDSYKYAIMSQENKVKYAKRKIRSSIAKRGKK